MLSKKVQTLIVSETQMNLDLQMVSYDIWGTTAHVIMLYKCGIVAPDKAAKILSALTAIEETYQKGTFAIDPERGAQLTLEKEIIARAGEAAGLSTHTARSRNDQVMVTEALFYREEGLVVLEALQKVLVQLRAQAEQHIRTVMPGYTHMQPGKPTTFAHWCLAYFDSLYRAGLALQEILNQFDSNPLGAVESFGTSWPIDRALTTKLLGFQKIWEIPQDAISNRGMFQLHLLSAFSTAGLTTGKLASDLMLYSTFEYGMVGFGEAVAQRLHPITGSSVMAQKKNPDALELIRSITPQLGALHQAAYGLLSGLPTGYNRDSREVKEYISIGTVKIKANLAAVEQVLATLLVNKDRMHELVVHNYSLTTDLADRLSQLSGAPYRRVYKIVGQAVDEAITKAMPLQQVSAERINTIAKEHGEEFSFSDQDIQAALDPEQAVDKRTHQGATNFKGTEKMVSARQAQIDTLGAWIAERRAQIKKAREYTDQERNTILQSV